MRKILKILFFLVILAVVGYQFKDDIRTKILPTINGVITGLIIKNTPCENPIAYTLGAFDTKFGISKSYFLSALAEAEAIWEKPFGKELFTYKEDDQKGGMLKINLVYDYRQEATSKLASLGIVVKDNRASYDMLKSKYEASKAEYAKEKTAFEARAAIFNQKQEAYSKEVDFWNKKGGAPKAEYDRIEQERLELKAESDALQIIQKRLNEMVDEINAMVVVLNRLVSTLNLSVDKYNTTVESRGESFEEGVYVEDGASREIDVYEFSSRDKLVRVLAHELGHALDIEHVEDPKAIMYKLNQGNNKTLTDADLSALNAKCGE